jgi:hypothetical protein
MVKTKTPPQLPSEDDILTILNATDLLTVTVRGHQCVETALTLLLLEALPAPHEIELSRLSFALKLDLALALNLIRCDSSPLFMALNRLRNRFAHDPGATFDAKAATDLANTFSTFQKHAAVEDLNLMSDPRDVLAHAFAVVYYEATGSLGRLKDSKLYQEVLQELVQDTLKHRRGLPPDKHDDSVQREIDEQFTAKKAARSEGPA